MIFETVASGVKKHTHYQTFSEFVDKAQHGIAPSGNGAMSHQIGESHWAGGSWKDALNLARVGWPEAERLISEYSSNLVTRISSRIMKPETMYAYEGVDFDMGRLMDGEPEHWLTSMESDDQPRDGNQIARILISCNASGAISTDTIKRRGAVTAALVRLLDIAGIRAELVLISSITAYGRGGAVLHTATLKQSDQDINYPVLGYSVCHPSVLRRLMFKHYELEPTEIFREYTYGMPCDPPDDFRKQFDLYMPAACSWDQQWSNPEKTEAWLLEQLTKMGVQIHKDGE